MPTPIIIIAILIFLFIIIQYNKYINLKNKVKQSKSSIEVYLEQRFSLIPNLVECVKEYSKYEKGTLERITELRGKYFNQTEKNLKDASILNSECIRMLMLSENLPELKANEHFTRLEHQIIKMESQLQAARRLYNGDVTLYNTAIKSFPTVILKFVFNWKEIDLFQIEEYKKENINL